MEGIVSVLKPPAMSSNDVVVDIRKIYGTKRVGHLGTLDPEAAGVLPVCIGRAVRLFDYLVDKKKEYTAEIVFGASTDTQDAQGKIISRSSDVVSSEKLTKILPLFTGSVEQIAPAFSALKYHGKTMYHYAKSGNAVPEKRRSVDVFDLSLLEELGRNRFLIRVVCSKGTYIRTLCSDIGVALGIPSHMSFLLRTRSGGFSIEQSFTLQQLSNLSEHGELSASLLSCEKCLSFLPELRIGKERMRPTLNGLDTNIDFFPGETVRLYADNTFLGIGRVQNGCVHLAVNLYSE